MDVIPYDGEMSLNCTFQRHFIYISNAVQKAFQIPSVKHFIYIPWNGSEWYQFGLYLKCVFKRFFHAQSKYISKVHFIGIPWNGYGWYHLECSWNVFLKTFHAQSKYISNWNVFEMLKSFHSTHIPNAFQYPTMQRFGHNGRSGKHQKNQRTFQNLKLHTKCLIIFSN